MFYYEKIISISTIKHGMSLAVDETLAITTTGSLELPFKSHQPRLPIKNERSLRIPFLTSLFSKWLKIRWDLHEIFPAFLPCLRFFLLILFLCRIFFVIAQPSLQNVHRIEIPYRAFPERVGPRIISLESVDYFGTDHFSIRKKKIILMSETSRFTGKSGSRIS